MFTPSSRRSSADSSPAMLFAATAAAAPRLTTLRAAGKTAHLDALVSCEAWTDAALELLALAAPGWSVQRLCRDDGEWLCTLTRFPDLPDWLDDCAEGRDPVAALAILSALREVEAAAATGASPLPFRVPPAPAVPPAADPGSRRGW